MSFPLHVSFLFRYHRNVKLLAMRDIDIGSKSISEQIYQNTLKAYLSRPPGAKFQVRCASGGIFLFTGCSHSGTTTSEPANYQSTPARIGHGVQPDEAERLLTKRHRKLRREFAKGHQSWTQNKWAKVLFSDEKNLQGETAQARVCLDAQRGEQVQSSIHRTFHWAPGRSHGMGLH